MTIFISLSLYLKNVEGYVLAWSLNPLFNHLIQNFIIEKIPALTCDLTLLDELVQFWENVYKNCRALGLFQKLGVI